ncbi:MAG: hypothetical protein OXG65_05970 [Chloroflexi bacterium]|nr:hypothetical protein [Chloroflexota bacterium]
MRRDRTKARLPAPQRSRRRLLVGGVIAAVALGLLAACGEQEVEHGKFKLRSGASW